MKSVQQRFQGWVRHAGMMMRRSTAILAVSGFPGLRRAACAQVGHTWDGVSPYPPGLGPHLSGPDAAASSQVALKWDAYGCSLVCKP